MWVFSWWPAAGSPRSYQCVQRIYMALRTYIWSVHEVEVHCPNRHAWRDMTIMRFHISKLSDFGNKYGENGIAAMLRPILRFSIWNFNDSNIYPHTYIRSMMFFPHLLGLVLIGRQQPHCCRRLVPFTPRLLTCFSTRPIGYYCRKNREHYSILTRSPGSSSRIWGVHGIKTEDSSTWYAISRTWFLIWLLLCRCCRCL